MISINLKNKYIYTQILHSKQCTIYSDYIILHFEHVLVKSRLLWISEFSKWLFTACNNSEIIS